MKSQAVRNSARKARRQNMVILLAVVMMGTFSADDAKAKAMYAGRITMSDPQEETTEDGKRVCIYSNSIYTFTTVTRSQNCPYSKTFDTEESE